jgi:chloramphenicol-sensitive protein RarD
MVDSGSADRQPTWPGRSGPVDREAARSVASVDAEADDQATSRAGVAFGVTAYGLWGVFPLLFRLLRSVPAIEILLHRVVWSFVVVVVVLAVQADGKGWSRWLGDLRGDRRRLGRLAVAGLLVAVNWLTYIWAVNSDRVVEAALGYYINPLITVALGVLVLGERLRRLQVASLALGAAAVVVLTAAYGRLPWVALVLATTFAGYGYLKKSAGIGAARSLAVETAVLLPVAVGGLDLAFLHGSAGRDVLLGGLGVVTAVPLLAFGAAATRIPLTLLGLLQYLTPTLQLLCGVVILGETLPPARLAGFVLVWAALAALGVDAVRSTQVAERRRADRTAPADPAAALGADGVV